MSAILRYNIGNNVSLAINMAEMIYLTSTPQWPKLGILSLFGINGLSRGSFRVDMTFVIHLPDQVFWAWQLLCLLQDIQRCSKSYSKIARNSAWKLSRKVACSLGLDPISPMEYAIVQEKQFLDTLKESPSDIVTWSAYADWLQDLSGETYHQQRGWIMAGWLSSKAMKVKYGVPMVTVMNSLGEINMEQANY